MAILFFKFQKNNLVLITLKKRVITERLFPIQLNNKTMLNKNKSRALFFFFEQMTFFPCQIKNPNL